MIYRTAKKLWNSPTFTAWANQAVDATRMVVLLPIILAVFDPVQVAVWLLFASLAFFSTVITEQLSLVFSRSIALAYGGATDLSPILPGEKARGNGQANWVLIEQLYGTIGTLNRGLSVFGGILTFSLGYFAIRSVISEYEDGQRIWIAFAVMLGGQYIEQNFRRYAVALRGLNLVALVNRWQAVFSLVAAGAGAIVVKTSGDIVDLAVVTQFFVLIGVVRLRYFLRQAEGGRFRTYSSKGWNKKILTWIWNPFCRGLVQVLANRGSVQCAVIIYSYHADALSLSALLLALRVLGMLEKVAMAPITNHVPYFSRLLAVGNNMQLRKSFIRAGIQCQLMLIGGCVAISMLTQSALNLIKADINFLPLGEFALIASFFILVSTIRQSLIISMLGNRVLAVKQLVYALIVSFFSSLILIPAYGFLGFAVSAYLPVIIIVNVTPLKAGISLLYASR